MWICGSWRQPRAPRVCIVSTNLNLASWLGNRELDLVVEDEAFGRIMEAMFEADQGDATEIVLGRWSRVRSTPRGACMDRPSDG